MCNFKTHIYTVTYTHAHRKRGEKVDICQDIKSSSPLVVRFLSILTFFFIHFTFQFSPINIH